MQGYFSAMGKYAVFRGRASRAEFWSFFLVYLGMGLAVVILDQSLVPLDAPGSGLLTSIFALVHLLPGMGVLIRRLHDINRSGWWALINVTGIGFFVLLIMAALEGTDGPNRHGADPRNAIDLAPADQRRHDRRQPDHVEHPAGLGRKPSFDFDQQGPYEAATAPPARSAPASDLIGELERLSTLRANGGLTDAEYEALKAQTLSRMSNA